MFFLSRYSQRVGKSVLVSAQPWTVWVRIDGQGTFASSRTSSSGGRAFPRIGLELEPRARPPLLARTRRWSPNRASSEVRHLESRTNHIVRILDQTGWVITAGGRRETPRFHSNTLRSGWEARDQAHSPRGPIGRLRGGVTVASCQPTADRGLHEMRGRERTASRNRVVRAIRRGSPLRYRPHAAIHKDSDGKPDVLRSKDPALPLDSRLVSVLETGG